MTSGSPRLARGDELDAVAALFTDAFADDALVRWPYGAETDPAVDRELWAALIEAYRPLDVSWILGDGPDAAAIWLPPAETERFLEIEHATRARILPLTADGGARYETLWDWIGAQLPDEPCWYLEIVAVAEAHRGKGLASALVRHGLDRAFAAGLPAFLETSVPGNVPRYEHLGFRVVLEADAPDGGPTVWFMRADPPD
jgi:GNAT superfamily N-acetyltransferase